MESIGILERLHWSDDTKELSSEARALVAAGALLLDVRTVLEFEAEHIASAVNIPVQELPNRLSELGPKNQAIVIYCRSGARSASAARFIRGQGFKVICDLGPMSAWHA